MAEINYIDLGEFLYIASRVLKIDPRVIALASNVTTADSALHAPQAGFGGIDFYPDFAEKAGVLGYRLARGHALPDGNKRTALLCVVEFIERNGYEWIEPTRAGGRHNTSTAAMFTFAAAGDVTERQFIQWMTHRIGPRQTDT